MHQIMYGTKNFQLRSFFHLLSFLYSSSLHLRLPSVQDHGHHVLHAGPTHGAGGEGDGTGRAGDQVCAGHEDCALIVVQTHHAPPPVPQLPQLGFKAGFLLHQGRHVLGRWVKVWVVECRRGRRRVGLGLVRVVCVVCLACRGCGYAGVK